MYEATVIPTPIGPSSPMRWSPTRVERRADIPTAKADRAAAKRDAPRPSRLRRRGSLDGRPSKSSGISAMLIRTVTNSRRREGGWASHERLTLRPHRRRRAEGETRPPYSPVPATAASYALGRGSRGALAAAPGPRALGVRWPSRQAMAHARERIPELTDRRRLGYKSKWSCRTSTASCAAGRVTSATATPPRTSTRSRSARWCASVALSPNATSSAAATGGG